MARSIWAKENRGRIKEEPIKDQESKAFIICGTWPQPLVADGTVQTNCMGCDIPICLSPSGMNLVREHDADPVCMACAKERGAKARQEGEPVNAVELNEEQLNEISAKTGQTHEQIKSEMSQIRKRLNL